MLCFAAIGDREDQLFGAVDLVTGVISPSMGQPHDAVARGLEPALRGAVGHDLRVGRGVSGALHQADERVEVGGTAAGLQLAEVAQLVGDRDEVDVLVLLGQQADGV